MSQPSGAGSTAIEPWLREILRCPVCRGELVDGTAPGDAAIPGGQAARPELHCLASGCRRAYRIDDGIPVLLVDEARSLAG